MVILLLYGAFSVPHKREKGKKYMERADVGRKSLFGHTEKGDGEPRSLP